MSTLVLPPGEFRVLREVCRQIAGLPPVDVAALIRAEEFRRLLAENVTAVKPGETLIIRVSDMSPGQMRDYQESFDQAGLPFRCAVVFADELAVVQADPDQP